MKTINIKPLELKAISLFAPDADIRYYLNGVLVEANATTTRLVATNGHYLAMFETRDTENENVEREEIIVPIKAVQAIVKAISSKLNIDVQLMIDGDRYELRYVDTIVVFSPCDGKFPDYKRVMPDKMSGEQAQFNGDYLTLINKAQRLFTKKLSAMIWHNGDDSALFQLQEADNFIGVIMPMRTNGRDEPKPTAPDTFWARQELAAVQAPAEAVAA